VNVDEHDAMCDELRIAYGNLIVTRRRRHRRTKIAVGGIAGLFVLAGAATGALLILPAPPHVQRDLAAVDQGLPADLRLNPDVQSARAVASSGSSTLYVADLKEGGYCSEIVTGDGRGRGATGP
jgi:hypothetical protein